MSRPLRQKVYFQLFAQPDHEGGLTITNRIVVAVILISIVVAVLSTEPTIVRTHYDRFLYAEMAFGVLFLIEYLARIWAVAEAPGPGGAWAKRWRFARSVIGLIDLAVVVASLFPFLVTSASILRIVRLLRLAELMQFGRFSLALREIGKAASERRYDLFVTLALAAGLILLSATALYWAEGDAQPDEFGSIPRAMWWGGHHAHRGGLRRCRADHAAGQDLRLGGGDKLDRDGGGSHRYHRRRLLRRHAAPPPAGRCAAQVTRAPSGVIRHP